MSTLEITSILQIKDLSYTYRGNWMVQQIQALKGVSLEVFEGESFGFIGHNGAGKTTCIKCILDLVRIRSGTIRIFGKPHTNVQQRAFIGYLPEQPYFYDHLSVDEILLLYARLSGLRGSYREVKKSIDEALDLVNISHRRNAKMRQLSKGLTQRVAMAQAIVGKPKLLIVDEPFSGLDPIGRKEFRDLFMHFKEQNTAIFMSSHILSDVEFLCDRVSIMALGSIQANYNMKKQGALGAGEFELVIRNIAPLRELLERMNQPFSIERTARGELYKILSTDRESADKLLEQSVRLQCMVESFNFIHAKLEDLFVKVMQTVKIGKE